MKSQDTTLIPGIPVKIPDEQLTRGMNWCFNYLNISNELFDIIKLDKYSQLDEMLQKRQEMLFELPELLKDGFQTELEEDVFKRTLEEVHSLENRSQSIINNRMHEMAEQFGKMKRYKRSIWSNRQDNEIPRYIDMKR